MRPNDFQATWRECGRNAASRLQDLLGEYVAHKHLKNTQAHSAPFCIRYIYIYTYTVYVYLYIIIYNYM